MSALGSFLNLFGYGGRAFADTVNGSIDRANYRYIIPPDSRLYIDRRTRKALNDNAEWTHQNFGIVKELVGGTARHTIGKGVSLILDTADTEWNELAEADFETYAMTPDRCDLSGRRDLFEAQATAIEQWMIRGEFFAALTENPAWDGEPAFQIYDSEEVGSPLPIPDAKRDSIILDGVEVDKNSRVIQYWIRALDGSYTPIPRGQMVHWYKPHAVNQTRGVTHFAQAVNPLVDIHELRRLATRSAKVQQFLAVVLKGTLKKRGRGGFGALENAKKKSDGTPDENSSQLEQIVGAAGGGIYYADENGEVQLVTSNSPSPLVEAFITDLLLRDVCTGLGVPVEFFWSPKGLNGNTQRFVLKRADLFFQILGDRLCDRFCTPIAFRYLSARMNSKKLRACTDPNWAQKIAWQLPARVSIDDGRENAILIELLANGLINMREYCNQRALNYRTMMRQWVREPMEFIALAKAEGLPPEYIKRLMDNLPLWRAPKPGAIQAPGADPAGNVVPAGDTDPSEQQAAA